MSDLRETAAAVAEDLTRSDVVVQTRPAAHRQVKRRVDVDRVSLDEVRAGFRGEGWTYDRHLYFDPEGVATRAAALAATYRESEGRLLVTHGELCDRLAGGDERQRVTGWEQGDLPALCGDAFEDRGWQVVDADGARAYHFPLYRVFRENHPEGRAGRSTAALFADYVATSMAHLADG
jgi:hypothetical protein